MSLEKEVVEVGGRVRGRVGPKVWIFPQEWW